MTRAEQPTAPEANHARLNNSLAPIADKILSVLKKHGPLSDLQLDGIFTWKVKMPERENVLRALEAIKLIRCQTMNGGCRLWIPIKPSATDKTKTDQKEVNHE